MKLPFWDLFKSIHESLFGDILSFDGFDYFMVAMLLVVTAIVAVIVIAGVISLVVYVRDSYTSEEFELEGIVVDKKYVPEEDSSGIGTAIVPNGQGGVGLGMVSTSSHSDEEFLVFVKSDKVYKLEVDMQQYYSVGAGDKVGFKITKGGYTGDILDSSFSRIIKKAQ